MRMREPYQAKHECDLQMKGIIASMHCPYCHSKISDESIFCPRCNEQLKQSAMLNTPSERPTEETTYVAFISYRHLPRDTEVAKQVQEAIETYHLPRSIQKAKDNNPDAVKTDRTSKLGKCFRDEDELAASHSLPESIQTALARSHSLIVICSPETKESAWVRREIETFAALHGRERIICVLAEGDSTDAIPEILKTKFQPDAEGIMREMPAEPLAADLRPANKAKQKAELLRLIAAVAGCNFDDLKQRDKNRRNKRIVIGSAVVLLLAILIGFFAYQASQNSEEALIANSKALAAQAQEQLARGERIQAVETALSALPSSEENPNRPLVEEAQTALENALGVNQDRIELWKPNFAFDTKTDIASFASNAREDWVAILEENGAISVVDIYTSKTLSTASLKDHGFTSDSIESDEWRIVSAGTDRYIVANRKGEGNIVCINALNGETLWEQPQAPINAIAVSEDEESCVLFTIMEDGSILVGLISTETGDALSYLQTDASLAFTPDFFPPCSYVSETHTAYLGCGGYALTFSLDEGTYQAIRFEGELLSSLQGIQGLLLGASANEHVDGTDQNNATRPYFFEAFRIADKVSKERWARSGIYEITVAGDPYRSISYEGMPTVWCIAQEGSPAAVFTAGSVLDIVSLNDGNSIYRKDFGQSVVGLGTMYGGENDFLVLALSDGTLELIMPLESAASQGTSFRTNIPYQVDQAFVSNKENGFSIVLLHAANQPNRLLSYRLDTVSLGDDAGYSLDELIDQAHELLDEKQMS